jgi:hypothetical protein
MNAIILDRAYKILKERGPMRGSDLGWELWGETTECANRGTGSQRHNKFCRAAGKVLKRLEANGLVRSEGRETCTVWIAQ